MRRGSRPIRAALSAIRSFSRADSETGLLRDIAPSRTTTPRRASILAISRRSTASMRSRTAPFPERRARQKPSRPGTLAKACSGLAASTRPNVTARSPPAASSAPQWRSSAVTRSAKAKTKAVSRPPGRTGADAGHGTPEALLGAGHGDDEVEGRHVPAAHEGRRQGQGAGHARDPVVGAAHRHHVEVRTDVERGRRPVAPRQAGEEVRRRIAAHRHPERRGLLGDDRVRP